MVDAFGGEILIIDTETNSVASIASSRGVSERLRQRDIYIEELKNELTLKFNARTDDGKKSALGFLQETYGTTSMTAIENMSNEKIMEGLEKTKALTTLTMEPEPVIKKEKGAKKNESV